MLDATLTIQEPLRGQPPLVLGLADGAGSLTFDSADYEESADRLFLAAGPPCAASMELTPEGHLLRISAPDGALCGLVLTGVRRRLSGEGCVAVTLGPGQHAVLDAGDVAHLLTGRRRTGRFVPS